MSMKEYRLAVVGAGGVGKSALIFQFVINTFVDVYDPTLEDTYRKQFIVDGEVVFLSIEDVAGQEDCSYQPWRHQYIHISQGFLIVYSVTSRNSFEEVVVIHQQILRARKCDAGSIPIIIVGNKFDLECEREVSTDEGFNLAIQSKCQFIEASAKTAFNVNVAFTKLAEEIRIRESGKQAEIQPKQRGFTSSGKDRISRNICNCIIA